MAVKLIALAKQQEDGFYAMVSPFLISREHPFYCVNDVFNAVFIHSNMLGDSMYYGRGAGKLPTASAVVADLVECACNAGRHVAIRWEEKDAEVTSCGQMVRQFFVRTKAEQAEIEKVFGQVTLVDAGIAGERGFVTGLMSEDDFAKKAEQLPVISRIRLLA